MNRIPPTENSFFSQFLRVNLEAYIWKHAVDPIMEEIDIFQHGFELVDGKVRFVGSTLPSTSALPEFKPCKCEKSGCKTKRCCCFSRGATCSELCKCRNCENKKQEQAESAELRFNVFADDSDDDDDSLSELEFDLSDDIDDEKFSISASDVEDDDL